MSSKIDVAHMRSVLYMQGTLQSHKLKCLIAGWKDADGMPDEAFTHGVDKSVIQIFPESHRP